MKFLKVLLNFSQKRNMTKHFMFVYGTLKKGEPNHHLLDPTNEENGYSKYVSKAKTVKKYPLVIASKYNIPFLLFSEGNGENVIGELYEVDEKMMSILDILEDHPSFYTREIDQVRVIQQNLEKDEAQSEKVVDSWIYFLKKFKPLLLKEEYLIEYHSEGSHAKPYTPHHERIPGYHAKVDVLLS